MIINYQEFKNKTKRDNQVNFEKTWYFASKFSKPISYLLFRIGLNANQATVLFFLVGLVAAFLILLNDIQFLILSYILYKLHIIIDLSDGDLARYYQKYTFKGAYMDYMIHSVLYPLFIINISIISYINFDDVKFLYFGFVLSLLMSLKLAVKNTFFRTLFQKNVTQNMFDQRIKQLGLASNDYISFININLLIDLISFEGFFFFYLFLYVLNIKTYLLVFFVVYSFLFLLFLFKKFNLHYNEKYISKN